MDITLYEFGPTRSARVRWALLELELPFTSREDRSLIRSDELTKLHPLGKLPAIVIDGNAMFESAAICTWLADSAPSKGLIAPPGSWCRAMHEQWSYFALAEMEAHVWSTARNTFVYPEEKRIDAIIPQNDFEFRRAAKALDQALDDKSYLVSNRFSVTDIIVAYAASWGRNKGLTSQCPNVDRWLDTLYEREHCTLTKPEPAAA